MVNYDWGAEAMGNWTSEAQIAIDLCTDWANSVIEEVPVDLYLFGSAIYKGGEQFDPLTSDIDLVALLPEGVALEKRVAIVEALAQRKQDLELRMIPMLGRSDASEPGVSLVPLTTLEVTTNIHKSAVRSFFTRNFFLNLKTGDEALGLPGAGKCSLPDENRGALELVQKVRNRYLSRAANLSGGIPDFNGSDPMPKELLRAAALLDSGAGSGEWYDTRNGLELLAESLRARRTEDALKDLYDKVSKRRGGRGRHDSLRDRDQLLVAELLFDLASNVIVEPLVVWEIRISGKKYDTANVEELKSVISKLAPDALFIEAHAGSIVLRYSSPESRLTALRFLNEKRLLTSLLEATDVELRDVDTSPRFVARDGQEPKDLQQTLLGLIGHWNPVGGNESELEHQLQLFLMSQIPEIGSNILVHRQVVFKHRSGSVRLDLLISRAEEEGQFVAIEIVNLRARSQFFRVLERSLDAHLPVIIVIFGEPKWQRLIEDTENSLLHTNGLVKLVLKTAVI